MIDEATDRDLLNELNHMTIEINIESLRENNNLEKFSLEDFAIDHNVFNTIKVQLLALRLVMKSIKNRSVKDRKNYWTLTPYGETLMTELRAIRRADYEESSPSPSKEAAKANTS